MIVPFSTLSQLPTETLNNLMKEYLLTQVEDGSFDSIGEHSLEVAMTHCLQALKQGRLLVEFSEEDESIAIRSQDDITQRQD